MKKIKIGAHISVKNEIYWIERVLNYHLNFQNFDIIIVNDDSSYDGTRDFIKNYSKKEKRIVPLYTNTNKGFTQAEFSSKAINILFNKYGCDYVFPLDADEFWYSEECCYLHEVLKSISPRKSMLITSAYDFKPTENDNQNESDVINRQFYCKINKNTKSVFCRASGSVKSIEIGNHSHTVVFKNKSELPAFKVPITMISRFHYPIADKTSFFQKIMNQVEGYTILSNGEWLHSPETYGGKHIWNHYMNIRKNGLENTYRNLIISNEKLKKLINNNHIQYKTCLKNKVPK